MASPAVFLDEGRGGVRCPRRGAGAGRRACSVVAPEVAEAEVAAVTGAAVARGRWRGGGGGCCGGGGGGGRVGGTGVVPVVYGTGAVGTAENKVVAASGVEERGVHGEEEGERDGVAETDVAAGGLLVGVGVPGAAAERGSFGDCGACGRRDGRVAIPIADGPGVVGAVAVLGQVVGAAGG